MFPSLIPIAGAKRCGSYTKLPDKQIKIKKDFILQIKPQKIYRPIGVQTNQTTWPTTTSIMELDHYHEETWCNKWSFYWYWTFSMSVYSRMFHEFSTRIFRDGQKKHIIYQISMYCCNQVLSKMELDPQCDAKFLSWWWKGRFLAPLSAKIIQILLDTASNSPSALKSTVLRPRLPQRHRITRHLPLTSVAEHVPL